MFLQKTALFAVIAGMTVASAQAQFGNSASSFGKSSARSVIGSTKGQNSSASFSGQGLSRLPLISVDDFAFDDATGDASTIGEAGSARDGGRDSQAVGTAPERWPYTTMRVAIIGNPGPGSTRVRHVPVTSKPYRFTGKLWMRFGQSWYVCTASLIKKGILITAAHCVHNFGQGQNGFADEVRWYPGNLNHSFTTSGGPWGFFQGLNWLVPTPYFDGVDTCVATNPPGIVCNNDIATVVLSTKNNRYAGEVMGGWNNYGWNAYGFVTSPAFGNNTVAAIHQLGYPQAFDGGEQMQRTTSFGKYITSNGTNGNQVRNIELGSAQTGGSSGGPWIVNFGATPLLSAGASLGSERQANTIIAVTSWGYTTVGVNVQGASYFGTNAEYPLADYGGYGAGNIGSLVNDTCTAFPTHC